MDGGNVTYGPVTISSGMEGYETPTGTSAVDFKDIDHRSSNYEDAPMPRETEAAPTHPRANSQPISSRSAAAGHATPTSQGHGRRWRRPQALADAAGWARCPPPGALRNRSIASGLPGVRGSAPAAAETRLSSSWSSSSS